MRGREERGYSFSNDLVQTPFPQGIFHWCPQQGMHDHSQVSYPDSSHLQLKSPKEFVLRVYYKEQLWAHTIKFRTKELRDSKRKTEPQTHGAACSVTGKANVKIYEPQNSLGWEVGNYSFIPPYLLPLCHICMSA